MKILIVSDTHRNDENLKRVIAQEKPLGMLIHLGDSEGSEHLIPDWVNPQCRMEMVMGNNDFFSLLDREREIEIGGHRAFITHGHYYGVSMGVEGLAEEAKSRGCEIAMYGHTHRPFFDVVDGVTVLNPGSLSYPRQEGRRPSYIVATLSEDGRLEFEQRYL